MSQECESGVFEEIEEEVKKLLGKERGAHHKNVVIYYFNMKRSSELGDAVEALRRGSVVIISFEDLDLRNIKDRVSILAQKIGEVGGQIYFIKRPALLLMRRDVELRIQGGDISSASLK